MLIDFVFAGTFGGGDQLKTVPHPIANAEEIGIAAEDAKVEAMFSKSVHLVDGSVADGFVDVEGGYVHAVFGQGAAGFFRIGFLRAGPAAATKTPASSSDATTDATTGESLYRKV